MAGIIYRSLDSNNLKEALNVMRNTFYKYEKVCYAAGVPEDSLAQDELDELLTFTAKDGVSIVAIDEATGKVVGVSLNKLEVPELHEGPSYLERFYKKFRSEPSKAVIDFMIKADSAWNLFDRYKIDCVLEIMFLGVLNEYTRRGIAKQLYKESIELARNLMNGVNVKRSIEGPQRQICLEPVPKAVSAICTSLATQKIDLDLGFERVSELFMSSLEFSHKGEKYTELTHSEVKTVTLDAFKL